MTTKLLPIFSVFVTLMVKHQMRSDRINQYWSNKYINCYEYICILALVNWHAIATVLYCIICHRWPVWQYHIFSHYLINGTVFRKTLLHILYIFIFLFPLQLLSETFLVLRRIHWDIIITVRRSLCEVLVVLVKC
jgi:hypothetical protein